MFSEEALPKGNGEYILGYYSNTSSSIAGVTEPFQVSTGEVRVRGDGCWVSGWGRPGAVVPNSPL